MAKKKLSRDQKRKQKKQKRARQHRDPGQQLVRRMQREGVKAKFVRNPPGMDKMSDVLLDFIDPYYEIANTEDALHKLITTAIVAWNTALLPETERADKLQQLATALPEETHKDFYVIVQEMIERKERYFAQYDRMILDYELVDRGGDYHVSVMSTPPGQASGDAA